MKFSIKDFIFFKRSEWSFGVFSPIYIKEMQEIINSVFLKKFHSLPEGLWNEISPKYFRKANWKLVEVCNVFSNWDLFVITFY